MSKLKKIQALIKANLLAQTNLRVKQMYLHNQLVDLQHQLNKADPGYKEEIEIGKEARKNKRRLIGHIYWKERFTDEDTKKYFYVERSKICSIDGRPCNEFGILLHYYDLSKLK